MTAIFGGYFLSERGEQMTNDIIMDEELLDRIINDVLNEEPLYVLIKGHLFIETMMVRMLNCHFECEFKDNIFNFSQKLELISAIGYIDSGIKNTISKINRVRNDLAHNVDMQIDEKKTDDILSTLPKKNKENIIKRAKEYGYNLSERLLADMLVEVIWQLSLNTKFPYVKYLDKIR
ncbi:hypothetical protein [Bacillus wiedmannii]|uniref:hypothetical protein n=1 Tax=Bacillus wiedmannii TaxID=1890302 RepID=UPI000B439B98|nr:hypothetical protein BK740_25610 [Bacillus thuringiensis serovar argentinensis]